MIEARCRQSQLMDGIIIIIIIIIIVSSVDLEVVFVALSFAYLQT